MPSVNSDRSIASFLTFMTVIYFYYFIALASAECWIERSFGRNHLLIPDLWGRKLRISKLFVIFFISFRLKKSPIPNVLRIYLLLDTELYHFPALRIHINFVHFFLLVLWTTLSDFCMLKRIYISEIGL